MRKLLLIAYFYPPLGGPGVQRPVKLVKYLKQFGWQTDVITVKDIVFHSYDAELAKEDAAESVIRAASFDPMAILKKISHRKPAAGDKMYFSTPENIKKYIRKLFPIDEKIGWYPAACRAGRKLIKQKKYDAVMATIGPYTSALIAYKLSRKFKIPLIIDYRDHWTLNPYIEFATTLHKALSRHLEARILQRAVAVSVVGSKIRQDLIDHFGKELENVITVMYNGWDETDFQQKINLKNDRITLRYVGNFYGRRTPKYFLQALEKLPAELKKNLKTEFVGNYYGDTQKLFSASVEQIDILSQTEHKKAVELMRSSDVLLLFIASSMGTGILTGKIFEYLRCRKPILAMIPPDGEAAGLLQANGHKHICAMEDVPAIVTNLADLIRKIMAGQLPAFSYDTFLDREQQAKKFIDFVEERL